MHVGNAVRGPGAQQAGGPVVQQRNRGVGGGPAAQRGLEDQPAAEQAEVVAAGLQGDGDRAAAGQLRQYVGALLAQHPDAQPEQGVPLAGVRHAAPFPVGHFGVGPAFGGRAVPFDERHAVSAAGGEGRESETGHSPAQYDDVRHGQPRFTSIAKRRVATTVHTAVTPRVQAAVPSTGTERAPWWRVRRVPLPPGKQG